MPRKQGKKNKKVQPGLASCKCCGGKHLTDRSKCPANGRNCHHCGKLNHFQTVCRLKSTGSSKNTSLTAAVEGVQSSSDSEASVFKVEHMGAVQRNRKGQYFVPLTFHSDNAEFIIDCQLDTGATCNVITYRDVYYVQQTGNPVLQATRTAWFMS